GVMEALLGASQQRGLPELTPPVNKATAVGTADRVELRTASEEHLRRDDSRRRTVGQREGERKCKREQRAKSRTRLRTQAKQQVLVDQKKGAALRASQEAEISPSPIGQATKIQNDRRAFRGVSDSL